VRVQDAAWALRWAAIVVVSVHHSKVHCVPLQTQFNFTFQEWPSVPQLSGPSQGPIGIKKPGHPSSVSSESVFGSVPRNPLLLPGIRKSKKANSQSHSPGFHQYHYDNPKTTGHFSPMKISSHVKLTHFSLVDSWECRSRNRPICRVSLDSPQYLWFARRKKKNTQHSLNTGKLKRM